jgi:hypothetical protein
MPLSRRNYSPDHGTDKEHAMFSSLKAQTPKDKSLKASFFQFFLHARNSEIHAKQSNPKKAQRTQKVFLLTIRPKSDPQVP